MKPDMLAPTVSMRYLPTVPLEFARPLGKREDFESKRSRADSQALAHRTTTFARTWISFRVSRSTYETPAASPSAVVRISRHMASVRISRFPVAFAGGGSTVGEEKLDRK